MSELKDELSRNIWKKIEDEETFHWEMSELKDVAERNIEFWNGF